MLGNNIEMLFYLYNHVNLFLEVRHTIMGRRRKNKRKNDTKILIYILERNESENNRKKISLKHLGRFVVSLVSVLASIATCFTLWEMRKERNQLYKPYFVIDSVEYIDEYESPGIRGSGIFDFMLLFSEDFGERPQIYLTINNIGAGTATNIDIKFTNNVFKRYWKIACENCDDDEVDITDYSLDIHNYEFDKCADSGYIFIDDDGTRMATRLMITHDLATYEAYIVPGDSIEVKLPEEYQILLHSIAYCTGMYHRLPEIELVINYDDLQGIHYTDTYKLSVELMFEDRLSYDKIRAKYIIEPCI